ncbi:COMM domain-containing protein 2 isoform X2 [Piliocolobus tephrosceles]|uniref:COMM domain-containing protein 2 isoform X2 n=1 Tax=Piliocolobus tephrosceles TaxID=591936 RepID=UPI000C2A846C|nr:COMM domain-containing protein 2 isoform X2 [Piliocolobus tephrosceles]
MLLELSEEHKEHLAFLPQVDSAVVAEFGRIAVEFLRRGTNPKIYEGAARKLNVSSDTVQHGVEGLTYLLTESSKLMISELDFQDSVFVLGFSEELNKLLLQLYLDNRKEIRTILSELAPSLPSYHNLEWRLDVQGGGQNLIPSKKKKVCIKNFVGYCSLSCSTVIQLLSEKNVLLDVC